MELASMYIGIHKKVHPWLKDYLTSGRRVPKWQQKLLDSLQEGKRLTFNRGRILGRGSGKTGAQLAYLEAMIGPQEPVVRPFRISDELILDLHSPLDAAIREVGRQAARATEQRIFDSLSRSIELQNGSRITAVPSSDNIRGQRYLHPGVITTITDESIVPSLTQIRSAEDFRRVFGVPDPHQFRMEYLANFGAGDRDGDVPSVHDDSGEQA